MLKWAQGAGSWKFWGSEQFSIFLSKLFKFFVLPWIAYVIVQQWFLRCCSYHYILIPLSGAHVCCSLSDQDLHMAFFSFSAFRLFTCLYNQIFLRLLSKIAALTPNLHSGSYFSGLTLLLNTYHHVASKMVPMILSSSYSQFCVAHPSTEKGWPM